MSMIDMARKVYEKNGRTDFDQDLAKHLENGFVISNPWAFMMLRVNVDMPSAKPSWHVTVAAGPMHILFRMLPFRLPYITFQRGKGSKQIRKIPFDRIKRITDRKT